MILNKLLPVTPSQRNCVLIKTKRCDFAYFLKDTFNLSFKLPLIKSKMKGLKTGSGRNNLGKITVFHRGGGHKKKYRQISFHRKQETIGIVTSIEYDPNRNCNIASIYNLKTFKYFYILAPMYLKLGDIIKNSSTGEPMLGHSLPIENIPVGSFIHNVSVKTKKKSQISRAAGSYSQLIEKTSSYGRIKLGSKEQRFLSNKCYATIGIVSNDDFFMTSIGKAGRSRWLNKRPKVRGVAMNPIDHPHGGGEGKTSGGRTSVTPWGKPTKNGFTSKTKNNLIVIKRKKNG